MAPLPRAENEFSASFPRKKGGNAAENIFLKKKIDFPLAQLVKVYCIAPEVKFRSKRLRKRAFFFEASPYVDDNNDDDVAATDGDGEDDDADYDYVNSFPGFARSPLQKRSWFS